ncbi:hypothetical protein AVEN_155112-1 [Araneus ventricosus]|uniref:Uncharacterized protein n=1 Tax=Araneus ventricosus TaxID=182803 RepID=A0A4Y2A7S1_ARAVE|nr:hypothetical protein AVEN_155112-1 [Araneus ventricosus]
MGTNAQPLVKLCENAQMRCGTETKIERRAMWKAGRTSARKNKSFWSSRFLVVGGTGKDVEILDWENGKGGEEGGEGDVAHIGANGSGERTGIINNCRCHEHDNGI